MTLKEDIQLIKVCNNGIFQRFASWWFNKPFSDLTSQEEITAKDLYEERNE